MRRGVLVALLAMLLAACARLPPIPSSEPGAGEPITLAQRIRVSAPQQPPRAFDTLVEVDTDGVLIAAMSLGVQLGRAHWNGRELRTDGIIGEWGGIDAGRIARDLLYALLPAGQLQRSLPADWSLHVEDTYRELRYRQQAVLRIDLRGVAPGRQTIRLHNLRAGYRLLIESLTL